MDFMEQTHYEFCTALRPSAFEKWAVESERKLIGCLGATNGTLDGSQWENGYSLDDALNCFNKGMSVSDYVAKVKRERRTA
jgi:hypothetical protein